LFEITNHPVCAAKEWIFLLMAQPPLLSKEGNGAGSIRAMRRCTEEKPAQMSIEMQYR